MPCDKRPSDPASGPQGLDDLAKLLESDNPEAFEEIAMLLGNTPPNAPAATENRTGPPTGPFGRGMDWWRRLRGQR